MNEEGEASMEITPCSVDEYCSGHAVKCMQRGNRQKCKCAEGWGGRTCSEQTSDQDSFSHNLNNSEQGASSSPVATPPSSPSSSSATTITAPQSPLQSEGINAGYEDSSSQFELQKNSNHGGLDDTQSTIQVDGDDSIELIDNDQVVVVGGLAGILFLVLCAFFCYKRRSNSKESSNPTSVAPSIVAPSAPPLEQVQQEQWEDWDDEEEGGGGGGGDSEMQPLTTNYSDKVSSSLMAPMSSYSPTPYRDQVLPHPAASNELSLPSAPPKSALESPRQTMTTVNPSRRNAPLDDYPPLSTDSSEVDNLFSDMGISAKPTFVKPKATASYVPSSKLALADDSDMHGSSWGGDDGLDDI